MIGMVGGDEAELKPYGTTDVIVRHADRVTLLARIRNVVDKDLIHASPEGHVLAANALSNLHTERSNLQGLEDLLRDKY